MNKMRARNSDNGVQETGSRQQPRKGTDASHVDKESEYPSSLGLSRKSNKKKSRSRNTFPTGYYTEESQNSDHPVSKKTKIAPRERSGDLEPYFIRQMELADLNRVFDLGLAIFTSKEFPNMYRLWDDFGVVENFVSSREFCYVVETEFTKEIIAFLLGETMTKYSVGTRGYIQWVGVVPQYRRHHIATELINRFISVAKDQKVSMLLADTPASNSPAINMFQKAGLAHKTDHVYLTRRLQPHEGKRDKVDEQGEFQFNYTAKNKTITIRNMEIRDLNSVYLLGNKIFTSNHSNIWNFWDEDVVMHSYVNDPEFCMVATVKGVGKDDEKVVGFAFGTTIEKPKSSWKYGYLVWTGCDPNHQGLGLASQLYNTMLELFAIEKVRMLMIDTQKSNEAAIKFFRKLGFGHDEEHVYLCNSPLKEESNVNIM